MIELEVIEENVELQQSLIIRFVYFPLVKGTSELKIESECTGESNRACF